jgi:hypothetical protein
MLFENRASLASCPINNMALVAIKMGRRSGSCRTKGHAIYGTGH